MEIRAGADEVYFGLQDAYHGTLIAPRDDMWATFADGSSHYELRIGGETAGCCSVNEERELHFFFLHPRFQSRGDIFGTLIERLEPVAALPSTIDPGFLSLSLDAGHSPVSKGLMYEHMLEPEGTALAGLHLAKAADHKATVAFAEAATGGPRSFLEPYFAEHIEKGHILLHRAGGEILASGECRTDPRRYPTLEGRHKTIYAHLGLIVGESLRGQGLGSRLMHALVVECRRRGMEPLCSTEPQNQAAQRVIHKAGFRSRHQVIRVELG